MTELPDIDSLFAAVDATWPAHRIWQEQGWTFRDGRGGGKRVCATTLSEAEGLPDIKFAARTMDRLDQPDLFMIRQQDLHLDARLSELGYGVIDPVTIMSAPLDRMTGGAPELKAAQEAEPTPDMARVWHAGGIGPTRLDIMRRCDLPKTCIALQGPDGPIAVAYAAISDGMAMCHAVEVLARYRRQGFGRQIMRAVVNWAGDQGADTLAILATEANHGARALYTGMGLGTSGRYHYRLRRDG